MYKIVYRKQVLKDITKLKMAGLSIKTKNLIDILKTNPFQNPLPYEKLVGDLQGAYSRRINIQHRLVYQVYDEEKVIKLLVFGHIMKIFKNIIFMDISLEVSIK